MLFLSWTLLYADRAITGPVIAWMIANGVGFMADAPMPHALGGIVGSMFFAGYMLTQFPAGYLGDKHGHRELITISVLWSGVATLMTGLARGLSSFVALRILTGLGEGAYYSNDRAVVCQETPERSRGMGLGIVFTGLALGMTLAFVLTPIMLEEAADALGDEAAWSVPFLAFSVPTLIMSLVLWRRLSLRPRELVAAGRKLLIWSACFLLVLMSVYLASVGLGLGEVFQAMLVLMAAMALIALVYSRAGMRSLRVLRERRMVVLYVSAIPILYTLWFFGFWALLLVAEASDLGLPGAALYAALFGLANGIGYPLGGRLCDAIGARGRGKAYVALCLGVAATVMAIALLSQSSSPDPMALGALLFVMGVIFAASQTVHMTLTADLAPSEDRGKAFGMWNLVAEIGAVLSPVVSGALRDSTGSWTPAILLDAGLLLASAALVASVAWAGKAASAGGAACHRQ